MPTIHVKIISDVVCPWCIVGYRQFLKGLELRAGTAPVEVRWAPFELNPDMPPEGEDLREHVAWKYGATPESSAKARARLTDLGASLGFAFNYAEDARIVNTFQAHQLLHWAAEGESMGDGGAARQTALKLALFSAYFTEQRDVSDPEVLVAVAESVGLDPATARAVLDDGRYAEAVRTEERDAMVKGIQGVPAFVFEERWVVSGAQGEANFAKLFDHVEKLLTAEAA